MPMEPDHYLEEQTFRHEAQLFLKGILKHWVLVYGGILGSLVLAVWDRVGFPQIPLWITFILAVAAIIVASFKEWKVVHRSLQTAEAELKKIRDSESKIRDQKLHEIYDYLRHNPGSSPDVDSVEAILHTKANLLPAADLLWIEDQLKKDGKGCGLSLAEVFHIPAKEALRIYHANPEYAHSMPFMALGLDHRQDQKADKS